MAQKGNIVTQLAQLEEMKQDLLKYERQLN